MSHTPEPWSFNDREDIRGNGDTLPLLGISIPMTAGARQTEAKANARRIVACVNACAGNSTAWLEGYGQCLSIAETAKPFRELIDSVNEERDTYRDLCAELTNALHNHYWNDCTKHSRSIEALIYKAKSILGDSNAT